MEHIDTIEELAEGLIRAVLEDGGPGTIEEKLQAAFFILNRADELEKIEAMKAQASAMESRMQSMLSSASEGIAFEVPAPDFLRRMQGEAEG